MFWKKDREESIGSIGERAARAFYEKRGYVIRDVNYRKPYGEIDIIAIKGSVLIFVEVKSVSCKTFSNVSREMYNPAENMHAGKRKRLRRIIESYLASKRYSGVWQCDLALVFVNITARRSRVEVLEDVIL